VCIGRTKNRNVGHAEEEMVATRRRRAVTLKLETSPDVWLGHFGVGGVLIMDFRSDKPGKTEDRRLSPRRLDNRRGRLLPRGDR